MIKVKILEHTPNPENLIANAARLCYSSLDIDGLFEKYTYEQNQQMINKLMDMGHESPIEHVSFTFGVEGVSRVLTHQLVRHRIASYSQKSQRYVKEDAFEYIIPKSIEENETAKFLFEDLMEDIQEVYNKLTNILLETGCDEKQAIEDARYVLPNACETKIIVTMNARTLLNFFSLRCCNRSQQEIRNLADKMLIECKKVAPNLFKYAGASCMFGKCKEGKMTCGEPRKVEEYE